MFVSKAFGLKASLHGVDNRGITHYEIGVVSLFSPPSGV
jgi:hypothetical protein